MDVKLVGLGMTLGGMFLMALGRLATSNAEAMLFFFVGLGPGLFGLMILRRESATTD